MTRIGSLISSIIVVMLSAPVVVGYDGPGVTNHPRLDMGTWGSAEAGVDYVEDELIVIFESTLFAPRHDNPGALSEAEANALNADLVELATTFAFEHGLELLDSALAIQAALFRVPRPSGIDAGERMRQVLIGLAGSDDRIRHLEPNSYTRISTTEPWSDPQFVNQYWHYAVVGGQRGWDTLPVDYHVRVAVIDTGFRFDHPDMHPGTDASEDFDFVRYAAINTCSGDLLSTDMDSTPGPDDDATDEYTITTGSGCFEALGDTLSHGTHVAGVIASAWDNGAGGAGMVGRIEDVSTGVFELIPIRAFDIRGVGSRWDVAQGIQYAGGLWVSDGSGGLIRLIAPADIINMSFNDPVFSIIEFFAVAAAFGQGSLMISSAGNGGAVGNPAAPQFPAAFGQVMAVSNMKLDGFGGFVLDPTSSAYPGVELTAPGNTITAISYDYSGCTVAVGLPCNETFGGVASTSVETGTSHAAPHVAGIAALYLAHRPTSTMSDLRNMLRDNAIDLGDPGVDDSFGMGLVQMAPGAGVVTAYAKRFGTAILIDNLTGAEVATTRIDINGNFSFASVAAGDYYILGVNDEDGDAILGETGEPVGAMGEHIQLAPVYNHANTGMLAGNFAENNLRWPGVEPENLNGTTGGAGNLFVGFYAESTYAFAGDVDFFRVLVPADGSYRIWTEGRNTSLCQENAFEYDSYIKLYDENGTQIASNEDAPLNSAIGFTNTAIELINGCSEIIEELTAGTYYVSVTPENDGAAFVNAKVILRFDPI